MSGVKPTSQPNQFVLTTFKIPGGGDIHETFKVDRYNNIYNAHTTLRVPGKISDNIDWQK